jgi:hypothetical protein
MNARTSPSALFRLAALAGTLLAPAPALAQDAAPPQEKPVEKPAEKPADSGPKATLAQLPPAVRLGARVTLFKRSAPLADAVLIVPTEAAYAAAIGSWSPELRFPVLIDDGTPEAAERIGLFVRGFRPARVLRWDAPGATFPAEPSARLAAMEAIIARAMGVAPADSERPGAIDAAVAKLTSQNLTPPGVVLVDVADASWAAGLALAAGHGQPIAPFRYPYGPVGSVPVKESAQIDALTVALAERLKLAWNTLGDDIDAITICANIPTKADTEKQGEFAALTDLVGRVKDGGNKRWAWAGQVYSRTASEGAYNAMCGLFIRADSAWLFNGYESGKPWSDYSPKPAVEVFNSIKLRHTVIDFPDGTDRTWRARAREGLDSSFIMVTTMGNADFFDLRPGRCKPGDVPLLKRPASVYFIHSWSMTSPASRETVGGRWMERGAFAYFGSVQEPYLQSFITPSFFAARFCAGAPWGAMLSSDDRGAWKVGSVGDPLYTYSGPFGKDPDRVKTDPAPGGKDNPPRAMDQIMRDALKAQDLAGAVHALVLSGRDKDATDVFGATVKDAPGKVTPALARAAIGACARQGNYPLVVRAFDALSPDDRKNGFFRDLLWFAASDPGAKPDSVLLGQLRANIRPDQAARDAGELGAMWSRTYNRAQAIQTLEQLRDQEANADVKAGIEQALKGLR